MRKLRANKILLLCALAFALCGCKATHTVTEVPVVVEHTSVQHRTDIVRDTLLMRDSVYHYVQGDTVRVERWHYSVKVKRVAVSDTVRDTVPRVVEVTRTEVREVAKAPPWWERALMWLGGIAAVAAAVWAAVRFRAR